MKYIYGKVMIKNGMIKEGELKEHFIKDGQYRSVFLSGPLNRSFILKYSRVFDVLK